MIRKVLMFAGSMLALSIMSSAQSVGISSTVITPDASSMLEIQATNKGLLMPRVALTATNAPGPIAAPATSLMVYNTATASSGATAVYPGYYYNAGTPASPNWVRFLAGRDAWLTTGNYGTSVATNWLGTNDAQPLVIKTSGNERLRVLSSGEALFNSSTFIAPAIAGDAVSAFITSNTNNWSFNGVNTSLSGGGVFAFNTNTGNSYNALEGSTGYTGTTYIPSGLQGLAIASSGSGIGVKALTNSYDPNSYGLYAKCMYSNSNGYFAGFFIGRVYATGSFYFPSDRKLKTNFSHPQGSLNKLMQLQVYEYDFNKDYSKFISSDQRQVGFIAQDVQQLFPGSDLVSSVSMIANNGAETTRSLASTERLDALAISYSAFVPYIVKAMQEQQQIIEDLKKRIEELEKANNGRK